jgi:hypothetical protein
MRAFRHVATAAIAVAVPISGFAQALVPAPVKIGIITFLSGPLQPEGSLMKARRR